MCRPLSNRSVAVSHPPQFDKNSESLVLPEWAQVDFKLDSTTIPDLAFTDLADIVRGSKETKSSASVSGSLPSDPIPEMDLYFGSDHEQHESGPIRASMGGHVRLTEEERKEKNRVAARRHRLARKQREESAKSRLQQLDDRNAYLKTIVAQAAEEVKKIRVIMLGMLKKEGLVASN